MDGIPPAVASRMIAGSRIRAVANSQRIGVAGRGPGGAEIRRKDMKVKTNSVFTRFTVIGAIVFALVPAGGAALEAASSGARANLSQAQNNAETGPAPGGQTLAGRWKLNRGQSDDPAQKIVSDDDIPLAGGGT